MQEKLIQEITNQLPNHPTPYAVFDFDNTCIMNDVGEASFAYLCEHNLFKHKLATIESLRGDTPYNEFIFTHYYQLLEEDKVAEAYALCVQVWAGFTANEVAEITAKIIAQEGTEPTTRTLFGIEIAQGLHTKPPVYELLEYLHEANIRICVVSASAEPAVRAAVAHFLPTIPCEVVGLATIQDEHGVYTDEVREPRSTYEGKVACIKKFIEPTERPILAAGDSLNDEAMVRYASIGVIAKENSKLATVEGADAWFEVV